MDFFIASIWARRCFCIAVSVVFSFSSWILSYSALSLNASSMDVRSVISASRRCLSPDNPLFLASSLTRSLYFDSALDVAQSVSSSMFMYPADFIALYRASSASAFAVLSCLLAVCRSLTVPWNGLSLVALAISVCPCSVRSCHCPPWSKSLTPAWF